MDSFKVTDEGAGIIRVDADTRLMRKPMAEAICAEVDELAIRYGRFKILMNLGAISKGTPGAGFYTLRRMKHYDMDALALFRAKIHAGNGHGGTQPGPFLELRPLRRRGVSPGVAGAGRDGRALSPRRLRRSPRAR